MALADPTATVGATTGLTMTEDQMRERAGTPIGLAERYPVRVAAATRNAEVKCGANVARTLGWPADRVGFLGALGGLIDLGAPMRRPRPLATLLVRQRADQVRAIDARMREQRDLAIRR